MLSKVTLKLSGMHCSSCAVNVDFELEDLEGVIEARTQYAKQVSVVRYDSDVVGHQKLIEAVSGLGYQAVIADTDV